MNQPASKGSSLPSTIIKRHPRLPRCHQQPSSILPPPLPISIPPTRPPCHQQPSLFFQKRFGADQSAHQSLPSASSKTRSHVTLAAINTPEQCFPVLPRLFLASNPASWSPSPFPSSPPALLYPKTHTHTIIQLTTGQESNHPHNPPSPRLQVPPPLHPQTYIVM